MRFHRNNSTTMAPEQIRPQYARHRVPPDYTPRLRLKPKADRGGYLDGAWWPRSRELTTELPDLLAVLTVRLGPIWRVVYDPACWSDTPRQTTVKGHTVRLDPYPFELWNTMYVFGRDRDLIVLRVIPSSTADDTAHTALMAAVTPASATLRPR
ncbi:DUF5994 family protein [Nocardia sp. NPDC049220]|uniref:DUF5994 family protein n=1 Tax=Nocardia sp. NPDC049220 TaxID=3155273 RepID=UPI00340EBFD8